MELLTVDLLSLSPFWMSIANLYPKKQIQHFDIFCTGMITAFPGPIIQQNLFYEAGGPFRFQFNAPSRHPRPQLFEYEIQHLSQISFYLHQLNFMII